MQKHILVHRLSATTDPKRGKNGRKSGKQSAVVRKLLEQSHDSLTLTHTRACISYDSMNDRRNGKMRIMNILVKASILWNCVVSVSVAGAAVFTAFGTELAATATVATVIALTVLLRCVHLTAKALNEEVVAECRVEKWTTMTTMVPRTGFNIIKYLLGDSEFPSKP